MTGERQVQEYRVIGRKAKYPRLDVKSDEERTRRRGREREIEKVKVTGKSRASWPAKLEMKDTRDTKRDGCSGFWRMKRKKKANNE